ncbi:MAG: PduL/EutD family phosphate acyltransferase, partial [Candidatus Staskawiczbacteria bacterium]|nr:PduL/EutD family phosphate acyltransferase [Candidatus Staskawiczbacteria bacterium]
IQIGTKKIEKVRVVGPLRQQTQVEISLTDAIGSGVTPQIKLSGDLNGTSPVALVGPKGAVDLNEGLIVAKRHIHCATEEAKKYKLKNGDVVSVEVPARNASHSDADGKGERSVVFENVILRVRDDYKLFMHIDTDEGNAADVNKIGEGFIIK